MDKENIKVLDSEVVSFLQEKAPDFLHSYSVLLGFYRYMMESFSHKRWQDGRIVFTPLNIDKHEKESKSEVE